MRTTAKERGEVMHRLGRIGIGEHDVQALRRIAMTLRRIAMTLHRWHELECGDATEWASFGIERDEGTGKPYMVTHPYKANAKVTRRAVPDCEQGALKRLGAIMAKYPDLTPYVQGDPRGAALYILRPEDIRDSGIDSCYSNGTAIY